jgi:TatD DNase family protein
VIDSHCHLADVTFQDDLTEVVLRAREAGVTDGLCILSAGDSGELERSARVAACWPEVRFSLGAHPHQAGQFADRVSSIESLLRQAIDDAPRICAIGEIGLDYHYDLSPRDIQREVFRLQVALAREWGMPVVVHTREADDDTIAILTEEGQGRVTGVLHCFTGNAALARRALDLGFFISFSGILTFPRAGELRDVALGIPIDRLLVETDCPYLAPVPYRGRRNEPAWVTRTAALLADLCGESVDALDAHVTSNFHRLFGPTR